MRIVRFNYKKNSGWGILESAVVRVFQNSPFSSLKLTKQTVPFKKISLLVPAIPNKIILVGLNYLDHARELKMSLPQEPVIFLKPNSALIAHKKKIIFPLHATRVDFEAELALVIKKKAKNVAPEDAKKYILGYTCLNDVTERGLQKKDGQWTRAKSFDTFCPLGPWVETEVNPADLSVRSYLNRKLKQDASTRNLIFSVDKLVSFISGVMTLLPGDVISTGTPSGVGPMQPGDTVCVEIEGIGRLSNRVCSFPKI